jgi:hypothetical protein
MSSTKSKGLCRKYQKRRLTLNDKKVMQDTGLLTEFNRAYNTLVEMVLQKDRHGYRALIGHIVSESTPPTNIGYLSFKIKLDKDLSKTIERIYKLLNLH